jgi:DNA repair exonuclease SbcCD nuclease subunit
MRILHLADLHFDMEQFAWAESQAASYDMVIIAGDLLERFGSDTPISSQQQLVLGSLRRIAKKCQWLAVCTGNHDVGREGDARYRGQQIDCYFRGNATTSSKLQT